MFSSTFLWVGLELLLLVVVVLYNTPRAKAARARRVEEYRQQEEQRKEKERAEAERKTRQIENFRKQRLVVYIREKDGRKSAFEAVLIDALLKTGVTVQPLEEKDGRIIASGNLEPLEKGVLAVVGTAWHTKETVCSSDLDGSRIFTRESTYYCDYRLLEKSVEGTRVVAAGSKKTPTSDEYWLARWIVEHIVSSNSNVSA